MQIKPRYAWLAACCVVLIGHLIWLFDLCRIQSGILISAAQLLSPVTGAFTATYGLPALRTGIVMGLLSTLLDCLINLALPWVGYRVDFSGAAASGVLFCILILPMLFLGVAGSVAGEFAARRWQF